MMKLIFQRSAMLMAGTVGSAALSFGQSIFMTRALAPEQMGVWAIGASVVMVTFGLIGFRSVDAINRFLPHFPPDRRDLRAAVISSALVAEFAAACLAMLLIWGCSPWLMPHLSNDAGALTITLLQAIATFLLWIDRPFQAVCRATNNFRRITEITLASGMIKLLATGTLFALGELTLLRFALLQVGISVITFVAYGIGFSRFMARSLSIGFSDISIMNAWRLRLELTGFWRMMLASFWSSCFSSVFKQADVILLGVWRGDADVGLYRVAKNLATLCQAAGSTLSFSIFTEINSLLSRRDYDSLWQEIRKAVRFLLLVAVIVQLGGIAAHWLIPFLFGQQYSLAAPLFQVQLIGVTFGLVLFWGFPLLIAGKGEWSYLALLIVSVLAHFGLSYLLLPGSEGSMPMAIIYSLCWSGLHTALAVLGVRRVRACRDAPAHRTDGGA